MTNYGTGNLVTHLLALIWCKNSNFQWYKVKYPQIFRRSSTLEVFKERSFIDTIMGISRDYQLMIGNDL